MKQIIQKMKLFFQISLTVCLSLLIVNINTISVYAEANKKSADVLHTSNNTIEEELTYIDYLFYDVETDEVVYL